LFRTALCIGLVAVLAGVATAGPALDEEQVRLNVEAFDQVWTTIREKHFDPDLGGLDWPAVREELRPRVEAATTMAEARGVMEEMLGRLGHSHVGIIPAEAYEAWDRPGSDRPGDGAAGLDVRVIDGRALVTAVWPGFPAEQAGVKPGWELLRTGEKEVAPLVASLSEEFAGKPILDAELALTLAYRLGGPVGETVGARFVDGEDREVDLELPLVEPRGRLFRAGLLAPHHVWIESRRIDERAGYIAFSNFTYPTYVMQVFNEAMASFLDLDGLVIDLRGNTGGLGAMVGWMAGWLVAEDDRSLGTIYMRETTLRFVIQPRAETYSGPVAILVDGLSASASEVFASGLQELGRARVFGSRTAGASLPAEFVGLVNGDTLIYPTSKHLTESGEMIEGVGVRPDVPVVPSRDELLQGRDPVLEKALAWIAESGEPVEAGLARNNEPIKEVTRP
jgi:carboxyl-terminal processing protease